MKPRPRTACLAAAAIFTLAFLAWRDPGDAFDARQSSGTEEEIRSVIERSYVDVVYGSSPVAAMREGFHPSFRMYVLAEDDVLAIGLDEWSDHLASEEREADGGYTHEFERIDITGDAAVVRLTIFRDGRLLYTDHLSLYEISGTWKIIAKLFAER